MEQISRHKILVAGSSFANCCGQVQNFLDLTTLLNYDHIKISRKESLSGLDTDFLNSLQTAENKNRDTVRSLIAELKKNGIHKAEDLLQIEQGYLSKTFHVLGHFLDGFIGIDSYFYNLPDDSHWFTPQREEECKKAPETFWLIHVDCFSMSLKEAGLVQR